MPGTVCRGKVAGREHESLGSGPRVRTMESGVLMTAFALPWAKKPSKVKILMVDDEVSFTRLSKKSLEMSGRYEVRTVNRARDALSQAEDFEPDVVLLDVMLPDGDGTEIATQIMDHPRLRRAHIIFLTAMVRGEEVDLTHGVIGGQLYIAKPVHLKVLTARIEEVLRRGSGAFGDPPD